MIPLSRHLFHSAAIAALLLAGRAEAQAQAERDSGFFGQLFGGSERFGRSEATGQVAPASPSELVLRLDRLENQIRQLTGLVEQLQYRNQQLEGQMRQLQEAGAVAPGGSPAGGASVGGLPPPQARPQSPQPMPAPSGPQRRSDAFEPNETAAPGAAGAPTQRHDVFDPNQNPNAPGAPRVLGSIPSSPMSSGSPPSGSTASGSATGGALPSGPSIIRGEPDQPGQGAPLGAPGGVQAGAPLDLSTMAEHAANDPALARPNAPPPGGTMAPGAALPPPPPRMPSATGAHQQQAMAPATTTPKEEYDLAYGNLVRKDYATAEENFRNFLRRHPADRLAGEANFWLGESLFQRQRYREAAESFLTVSTKFEKSGKAPDALVRLGQSLAALKEKEAACATFSEVGRKYPRASPSLKQNIEREQKRVGC